MRNLTATGLFGLLSLTLAILAMLAVPLGVYPPQRSLDGYLFLLCMMMLVSAGLIVAARLKASNNPLAEKAVPSTLVAYLLFLLMAARWFGAGG